jgi:hypothetical protein
MQLEGARMTQRELPYRATTQETCDWLDDQTGTPWSLVRLLESGLIPSVWLDYSADYPELFAGGEAGFYAPVMFAGDTQRLIAGSDDVVISFTKDADKIALALKPPGICRPLDTLRFFRWDVEKLLKQLNKPVIVEADVTPVQDEVPKESQLGISKEQVISAFAALVKIDLDKALTAATGIFGDEGARVKSSTKKAKSKIVWNPVTLALGLNDAYKVPMPYLKRAFNSHAFLREWRDSWEATLDLLGE